MPNPLAPLRRKVQQLRAAVYARPDPAADPELLQELAAAETALRAAEAVTAAPAADAKPAAPAGRLLGPDTTKLKVEPTLHLNPVPTSIYPLLDPETDPLLTVVVRNTSLDGMPKRVCVRAWIEGLSAETVRTVEIRKGQASPPIRLLPLLFPERAGLLTEIRRATLHLVVDELGKTTECHDTFPLVLLSRTSGFNAAADPATGLPKDLTHYYGAWVTPYAEPVQALLRVAAGLAPGGQLWGYLRGGGDRGRPARRALGQQLGRPVEADGLVVEVLGPHQPVVDPVLEEAVAHV